MITQNPPAPIALDPADEPTNSCTMCPHPLDTHDRIAARYCQATQSNAIARGCICS
jgi:hypothetical protein